jgi:hypothetical protein
MGARGVVGSRPPRIFRARICFASPRIITILLPRRGGDISTEQLDGHFHGT